MKHLHYRFQSSDSHACLKLYQIACFIFFFLFFIKFILFINFSHFFFSIFILLFSFLSLKKKEKQNLNILGRKLRQTRSGNSSPVHYNGPHHTSSSSYHHNSVAAMGSPYYRDMDEPQSPAGGGHHRSRSASRPPISHSIDYPSKYNNFLVIFVQSIEKNRSFYNLHQWFSDFVLFFLCI